MAQTSQPAPDAFDYAEPHHDAPARESFDRRAADWRNGAVIYQVIVDRFAPPADPEAKRHLYPAPKRLRAWSEEPRQGIYLEEERVWSHEIDFWGGDLDSLRSRLDYVEALGVDVLYLNPIHQAYTNHKYDAQDYREVSPEYGTREDVAELAEEVHGRGMKLILDGVFNHMGATSPFFLEAKDNSDSPNREWFFFGDNYALGYRAWYDVANLPELNLESERVQEDLFAARDSVIQSYLRDIGVDGWRLDVAFDIGPKVLDRLTKAAHKAKKDSWIIGEVWNYPEGWMPAVDGIMNMHARHLILMVANNEVEAGKAGRLFETMVEDVGLEPLLKCWIILDNHDTPRLATWLKEPWQREMAQALQFTLPGSPCLYYGTELGMKGGNDPEMRGPMRWDLVEEGPESLEFTRALVQLRKDCPALRYGDFRRLESDLMLAFLRFTERVADTAIILANPTDEPVTEVLSVRNGKLMAYRPLRDALSDYEVPVLTGTITPTVPPRTVMILRPVIPDTHEYSPYKRVL